MRSLEGSITRINTEPDLMYLVTFHHCIQFLLNQCLEAAVDGTTVHINEMDRILICLNATFMKIGLIAGFFCYIKNNNHKHYSFVCFFLFFLQNSK